MAFVYRVHAIERMFQRDISEEEVEDVVENGEIIETYPDDEPYPSYLVYGTIKRKVIHVVYAKDESKTNIIITVYEPTLKKWNEDLKTRRGKNEMCDL